jgi:uroporphyrin-3 C-methyltransferase
MAEKNHEQMTNDAVITPSSAEEPPLSPPPSPPSEKNNSHNFSPLNLNFLLALFAVIVAFIAVAESAVILHRFDTWKQTNQRLVKEIQTSTSENQIKLRQFANNLQSVQTTLASHQTILDQAEKALQEVVGKSEASTQQWVLTEVLHLLRLSNLSLQYGHDVTGSIALLQAARQELEQSNDSSFLPLQQALANNILALKAVPTVNTIDILTRLTAVSQQIPSLALFVTKIPPADQTTATTSSDTPQKPWISRWRQMLANSFHSIEKLVIIRHTNQPIRPLLPAEQQDLVVKNIQFFLGQAQWAVLHRDQNVYQFSLQQATQWIKQYFTLRASATVAVLNELASLQQIQVNPPLPNLAPTLLLVEKLIATPQTPKVNNSTFNQNQTSLSGVSSVQGEIL